MKSLIKIIILMMLFSIICSIGCSSIPLRLGAPHGFDRTKIDFTKPRVITAEASGLQFGYWFPIMVNSRQLRAYEEIKSQAMNDYITDVKIKESWTWALVGTVHTTRLEATAYPMKN